MREESHEVSRIKGSLAVCLEHYALAPLVIGMLTSLKALRLEKRHSRAFRMGNFDREAANRETFGFLTD